MRSRRFAERFAERVAPARAGVTRRSVVAFVVVLGSLVALVGSPTERVVPAVGAQEGGSGLPAPEPDPEEVRAEADRILSGEEFGDGQGQSDGPAPGGDLGSGGTPPEAPELPQPPAFSGMGTVGRVVMWIVVVALVALAGWVLVRAVLAWRRRARDEADDEVDEDVVEVIDEDGEDLDPMLRPAEEWRRLAAAAEAEQRWREGLRFRYRALLADLIERSVVGDVPGRTTGEYRTEVAEGAPVAAVDFADASELFDRAWYGARPTGAAERDRFVDHEGRVLLAVRAGAEDDAR